MWYKKTNTPKTTESAGSSVGFRDDLFSLMDDFFKGWETPSLGGAYERSWQPVVNISETEKSFQIETELPGVEKKDIKMSLHDQVLTIQGEKKSFKEDKKEQYHRVERSHGSFSRSIKLPKNIDSEKVTASMQDGVLHVEVEKLKEAQDLKRTIEIR